MDVVSQSILETIAYFDIFDTPLTREEIGECAWEHAGELSVTALASVLDTLQKNKVIGAQGSYYFLPAREAIVAIREAKVKHSEKKLQTARTAAKLLRLIPFLRAVFICNTVALGSASKESDIDVLIITKHGRLWLTRLLATILLSFARLRRTVNHITDKICLSFYLTDEALNLSSIALPYPDIYLAYWSAQLIPLYDPDNLLTSIRKANAWASLQFGTRNYILHPRYAVKDTLPTGLCKKFFSIAWQGKYGDALENQAKTMQREHMERFHSGVRAANSQVVISDCMLKFHENDRREHYKKQWLEKCANLIKK